MQLNALCKQCKLFINPQTLRCMKITAFILMAFCIQVSATALAQKITLSERKAPLEKVINEIKKQTGYSFFYNQEWLQAAQPVDVQLKNASLEQALKSAFANQPFDYAIVNNTIVLKLKEKTILPPNKEVVAPVIISGRVTDSVGTALIGATVAIKGSKKAVSTNENGEFSIPAEIGDVIVISFIGYGSFDFTVNGNMPYLAIKLNPLVSGLKEVVVSTGYQTISTERATGSYVHIDNQLFNRRTSPDVLSKLEGIVPGLLVNRNVSTQNNPNGIDISIQGYSTLYANAQPLIVIDNFPYDGNIQNINPNDVESITVLKDAAAASIWGARSGNGVIVITTKKGRKNRGLEVTGNVNYTIAERPNLYYSPNFIKSSDFITIEQNLFSQGYYDSTIGTYFPVSPVVQILADQRDGKITAAEANARIEPLKNIDVRNDLSRYFYRKVAHQQYGVSLAGGNSSADYYFSLGYDNDKAGLVGNNNNRLTLTTSDNFYPVKGLTLSLGLNYIQSNFQNNSPVGNINSGGTYSTIYPYAQLVGANGQALAIVKDYNQSWVIDPAAQAGYLNWQYKPLDEITNNDNRSNQSDNRINAGLKYDFLKNFNAEVKYQYERLINKNSFYNDVKSYYARNLINTYTDFSSANKYPIPIGGIFNNTYGTMVSNHLRAQVNYAKNWDSGNALTALLAAEISDATSKYNTDATAYGYDPSNGSSQNVDFVDSFSLYPSLSSATIPNRQSFGQTTDRFISYIANAGYTFQNKYTLFASSRIDKSNLFGVKTNQKSNPFFSTGASWNISKEPFYKITWLPLLKLRTSYGYNGNIYKGIPGVLTTRQLVSGYFFPIPNEQIINPGNPQLRWEKVRKINIGLDFAFKDELMSGSIDYYFKKGTDLFGNSQLAPSTGQTDFFGNTASTKGKGLDFVLNIKPIRNSKFTWESTLSFSYAVDKVAEYDKTAPTATFLFAGADGATITPQVGKPIFSIYSYRSGPLTHNTGDPQGYLNGKLSTDYANIIRSASTVDSLVFNGSARPTAFGYLRNTFRYKSITLSANIVYKLNYYFRRNSISYYALANNWQAHKDFYSRWLQPGDESKTIVPSMPNVAANIDPNRETFYNYSQSLIDKGDHIRLQDITLSYDFGHNTSFGRHFKQLQVYFYVNNVGILWRANRDHLDPDTYNSSFPLPRTYSLGIKSNF